MANGGVNVKIGVSGIADFKRDINSARNQIKTMDADLALVEKQFKATGDAEAYMQQKTELLKGKLDAQKNALEKAEAALKTMKDNGVSPASAAFQEMQRKVIETKSGLIDTETALKNVGTSSEGTNESLKNIDRGVAFENITDGLDKVISKLESGAKAAINFGKKIVRSAMDSTGWADDVLHEATKYGVDAETIQKMQNVAEFIETDVDTIMSAKARLAKNKDSLPELMGFSADGLTVDEAFWKAGEAIMAMTDEFQREETAQEVFGRGWKELIPLFAAGQDEYNQLLERQSILTNAQVESLGKADDAIKSVQQQIEMMKNQFWAENADKIVEMGQWIIDNKDGLVAALAAIAAGFGALKLADVALNIAKTVNGFQTLWNGANNPLPNVTGLGGGNGAAGAAGTAASTNGGFSFASAAGIAGAALIGSSFVWAADRRRNHAEEVRGTDANFEARTGDEDLRRAFVRYIEANNAAQQDPMSEEAWKKMAEAQEAFTQMTGSAEMMSAYSDWLQENSMRMGDLPETLEGLRSAIDDLSGDSDSTRQSNSEMTMAANDLQGLPAEMRQAVIAGMSGVTINIDGQAAGNIMTPYIGGALGLLVMNR